MAKLYYIVRVVLTIINRPLQLRTYSSNKKDKAETFISIIDLD